MAAAVEHDLMKRRLDENVDRLAEEFSGVFSRETIDRCCEEALGRFRVPAVSEFLPVLIYRFARERLQAQAQVQGLLMKERPEILFVCVHNAGRSQMAAVLTEHLSGDMIHVRSAGSEPAMGLNPVVSQAMSELGLDMSREFPKPLTDDVVEDADVVITMGCGDACPVFPGKKYLDWELDDPAGRDLAAVRRIRDEIRGRVEALLSEMGIGLQPL